MSQETSLYEIKILVIENESDGFLLQNYLNKQKRIRLVGAAQNARNALDLIDIEVPDLIILDWATMGNDIFTFLKQLRKKYPSNINVVLLLNQYNHQYLSRLGDSAFDYFIIKPFNTEALYKKVLDISNKKIINRVNGKKNKTLMHQITSILLEIGVPLNIIGYKYLHSAIQIALSANSMSKKFSADLYSQIAARHYTNSQRVERNIRHAITLAWSRKAEQLRELFGNDGDRQKDKSTNMEFILTLAKKVKHG